MKLMIEASEIIPKLGSLQARVLLHAREVRTALRNQILEKGTTSI